MWKDLNIQQKSEVMKMAISQGLTDLNEIKKMYDASIPNIETSSANNTYSSVPYNPSPKDVRYDDGGWLGYLKWKDAIGKYKGIDTDDPAYDYAGFYIENPKRAWALLNGDPNAHFVDTYKTVYHPTFSDESMYSGMVSPQYNPEGLIGGSWRKYPDSFTMSTDLYRSPVSMDERIQYLENNEPEGIVLREYDGSLPMFNDGSLWGGVKPIVEVSPHAYGGPLGNIYKGTGNKSQKLNIWTSGAWTAKDLADELKRRGIRAKVTSGYRSAAKQSQFGTPANKSWHVKNKAIDVVPTAGWDNLIADLTTPENAAFFNSIGIGVLDERPLSIQKQTKATGPHFHIGPDKRARANYAQWVSKDFAKNNTPQIDYNSPIYDTSWQSIQWQPPVVASSRQEDIAPLLVQDNKPLIVEPLEDTSSTPKDFSAIWDQIFPKVENTQEEFNPLLDPSTQFTALQSRPRYQMKSTPIINMPVSNGDNDYMLFKPLAKGGNLFAGGGFFADILNKVKKVGATIRGEKVGPTYDKKKRRWYNSKGQELKVGKGYYSKAADRYVLYGTDGSVTKYRPLEWAEKKWEDITVARDRLSRGKYAIPTTGTIQLSQNGKKNKDRGAWVNQAMVDSLLKYGNIAGIPKWEALGLAAVESTFGSDKYRQVVTYPPSATKEVDLDAEMIYDPVSLLSNWHYTEGNPYASFYRSIIKSSEDQDERAKLGVPYLENQVPNFVLDIPPILDAFLTYKAGKYNPGNPNYNQEVKNRGEDLKYSPELVEMVNNSEYNY